MKGFIYIRNYYSYMDNWIGLAVCGAPKRRFRAYEPPVNKNANAMDVRKARKAELQREEALGLVLLKTKNYTKMIPTKILFWSSKNITNPKERL